MKSEHFNPFINRRRRKFFACFQVMFNSFYKCRVAECASAYCNSVRSGGLKRLNCCFNRNYISVCKNRYINVFFSFPYKLPVSFSRIHLGARPAVQGYEVRARFLHFLTEFNKIKLIPCVAQPEFYAYGLIGA